MTTISSASATSSLAQLWQTSSTGQTSQAQMPPPPKPPKDDGKMQEDMESVLSGLGINTDEMSDEQSSALSSFMQTLMETLHSQGAGDEAIKSGDQQSNPMQLDLQSLISKLTGSSDDSSDSGVSSLQSQFSSLLDSFGASDSGVTLDQFVSAFASKVPSGRSEPGYVIDTTA